MSTCDLLDQYDEIDFQFNYNDDDYNEFETSSKYNEIELFFELLPQNYYVWKGHRDYHDRQSVCFDEIGENLYVWNTTYKIFFNYAYYGQFLNKIDNVNNESKREQLVCEYGSNVDDIVKEFKFKFHKQYQNKLSDIIKEIPKEDGLWICFIEAQNNMNMKSKKKRYNLYYGNYLEYRNTIENNFEIIDIDKQTMVNNFEFMSLCVLSHMCQYHCKNIDIDAYPDNLKFFMNIQSHCYDYGIAKKYKKNVVKQYQMCDNKLSEDEIEEYYKATIGSVERTILYMQKSETNSTELYNQLIERIRSQYPFLNENCTQNTDKFKMGIISTFLFIVLIKFNKEMMWHTGLQRLHFENFDWQNKIREIKGGDFLQCLKEFSKKFRYRFTFKYKACDWCTFLDYWLKYDTDEYPNFFSKLSLIIEIYGNIFKLLFDIHDRICHFFL